MAYEKTQFKKAKKIIQQEESTESDSSDVSEQEEDTTSSNQSEEDEFEDESSEQLPDLENKLTKQAIEDDEKQSLYSKKIIKKSALLDNKKISIYGFPNKETAQKKEVQWQKQVSEKFFRVGKPLINNKKSHTIYTNIKKYIDQNKTDPISINGCCRRSFIIALSKILSENIAIPSISFKLGVTIINFVPSGDNGTKRQKGNFMMQIPGIMDIAYGTGLMTRLNYLTKATWDNEYNQNEKLRKKQFIKLINGKLPTLQPFNYTDLNYYGNIRILHEDIATPNKIQNLHLINGLIFLVTVVEVLVRLYRTPNGSFFSYSDQKSIQSDSFPVAMAQARSILLLLNGKITFNAFFGQSELATDSYRANYGAVTGKNTIDNIKIMFNKLATINDKHNDEDPILNQNFWEDVKTEYLEDNEDGYFIAGKSKMKLELEKVYGSGSESDSSDSAYSDSEEFDQDEIIRYQ